MERSLRTRKKPFLVLLASMIMLCSCFFFFSGHHLWTTGKLKALKGHFTHLIPKKRCEMKTEVLFAVMTTPPMLAERKLIRQTWGSDPSFERKWRTIFVMGIGGQGGSELALLKKEEETFQDIIFTTLNDSIAAPSQSLEAVLEWISTSCQDGVDVLFWVKPNSYVFPSRVSKWIQTFKKKNSLNAFKNLRAIENSNYFEEEEKEENYVMLGQDTIRHIFVHKLAVHEQHLLLNSKVNVEAPEKKLLFHYPPVDLTLSGLEVKGEPKCPLSYTHMYIYPVFGKCIRHLHGLLDHAAGAISSNKENCVATGSGKDHGVALVSCANPQKGASSRTFQVQWIWNERKQLQLSTPNAKEPLCLVPDNVHKTVMVMPCQPYDDLDQKWNIVPEANGLYIKPATEATLCLTHNNKFVFLQKCNPSADNTNFQNWKFIDDYLNELPATLFSYQNSQRNLEEKKIEPTTQESKTEFQQATVASQLRNPVHLTNLITTTRCEKNFTVVFIVTSKPNGQERRQIIRDSWGEGSNGRWKLMFATGVGLLSDEDKKRLDEEQATHGDLLFSALKDNYFALTLKLQASFEWAVRYCSNVEIMGHIDDDVWIETNNLFKYLDKERKEQPSKNLRKWFKGVPMAYPVLREGKWQVRPEIFAESHWPPYPSGPSYFMGMDHLASIVDLFGVKIDIVKPVDIDDSWVGIAAREANVTIGDMSDLLRHWTPGHFCPIIYRAISTHSLKGECLMKMAQLKSLKYYGQFTVNDKDCIAADPNSGNLIFSVCKPPNAPSYINLTQWIVTKEGQMKVFTASNKSLCLSGDETTKQVTIETCHVNNPKLRWTYSPVDHEGKLQLSGTNLCLTYVDRSVTLAECAFDTDQLWQFIDIEMEKKPQPKIRKPDNHVTPLLSTNKCLPGVPILVAVMSSASPQGMKQRRAIRTSWGKREENSKFQVIFFVSNPPFYGLSHEQKRFGDIVLVDTDFTQETNRMQASFEWISLYCNQTTFVIHSVENSYVYLDKWIQWIDQLSATSKDWYGAYVISGASVPRDGYHMVKKDFWAEDKLPPYADTMCFGIGMNLIQKIVQLMVQNETDVTSPTRYTGAWAGVMVNKVGGKGVLAPWGFGIWGHHSTQIGRCWFGDHLYAQNPSNPNCTVGLFNLKSERYYGLITQNSHSCIAVGLKKEVGMDVCHPKWNRTIENLHGTVCEEHQTQWVFTKSGTLQLFTFYFARPTLCLTEEQGELVVKPCSQQVHLWDLVNGTLRVRGTSKCVTAGSKLSLSDCTANSKQQQWYLIDNFGKRIWQNVK